MEPSLKQQGLPADLQVMSFQLQLMKLIGLVGPQGRFHRFLLAFGWGSFVILLPKIVLGMGSTQIDVVIKGLSELLFQVNLYVSVALLVLKLPSFKRMVLLLVEIVQEVTANNRCDESRNLIQVQNISINKFGKFYFTYCCFGPLIYCIPAMVTSYVRYFNYIHNDPNVIEDEPPTLQFELAMEQEFYGLQIRTNFIHYHLFMAVSLSAYYVCSYISVIKVTALLSAIRYSSMTFSLVSIRIGQLERLGRISNADVQAIVQLHKKAFRLTALVEDMVCIPLAMQFMTCILFWCLVMFYVSTNINLNLFNVMVPFGLSMIETYGYAYLATELTTAAQRVSQTVYELPWYEETAEIQRYFRLIIQRAQRDTGITAAKFFLVGIGKFGRVVQMSYSYYLVLRDVFNKL